MLCVRLRVSEHTLGALNLVSQHPDAFDHEAQQIALLLASHAAVAIANARKLDQLQHAVAGRDLIGQAKGMLMERYRLDQEHAFDVLTRISQTSNRKLHDIADQLVTTGRLEDLDEPVRPPTPGAGPVPARRSR